MAKKLSFGGIIFLVGLVLAAIVAALNTEDVPSWAVLVIALIGLVVGLLNIMDWEIQLFLVSAIAFLISFQALSSVLTTFALGWEAVGTFFGLLSVFVAPAAAVVAIKALFQLAKH